MDKGFVMGPMDSGLAVEASYVTDKWLRKYALDLAVKWSAGYPEESVVRAAEKFYAFLKEPE